ncbi:MAG TPA: hypothetical protein VJN01_14495, partial [Xanthomonadales bacterium]|nr:hypothetical protein [Xanthomonadales bacterium]
MQAKQMPATPAKDHTVLLLSSFNEDTEPYAALNNGLMRELQVMSRQQIIFQQFDLQQRQV